MLSFCWMKKEINLDLKYDDNRNGRDDRGITVLHHAAILNHTEIFHLFLGRGADINAKDNYGNTPLHFAVHEGQLKVIDALLKSSSIDINVVNNYGITPLFLAAKVRSPKIARVLLSHPECNVNMAVNDAGMTMLHYVVNDGLEKMAALFLNHGATDVNVKNNEGQTPLHAAVAFKQVNMVKALLQHNSIQANLPDNSGKSPLMLAVAKDLVEIVGILLSSGKCKSKWSTKDSTMVWGYICENHLNEEIVRLLTTHDKINVNAVDARGETFLHVAVNSNRLEVVETLLQCKSIDPILRNSRGETPLMLAVSKRYVEVTACLLQDDRVNESLSVFVAEDAFNAPMYKALSWGYGDIVALLLSNEKCDVNLQMRLGMTALHVAVSFRRITMVDCLLKKTGIKINKKNNSGESPLFSAVTNSFLEGVHRLLDEKEIDLAIQDDEGRTPLHYAINSGPDIFEALSQHPKAKFDVQDKQGRTLVFFAAYLNKLAYMNVLLEKSHPDTVILPDKFGVTPLVTAIKRGYQDIVARLLQEDNVSDCLKTFDEVNGDNFPLYVVIEKGFLEMVKLLLSNEKCNVNMLMHDGFTALHWAQKLGRADIVSYLLSQEDVDVAVKANDGKTAFQHAVEKAVPEILDKFIEKQREALLNRSMVENYLSHCSQQIDQEALSSRSNTHVEIKSGDLSLPLRSQAVSLPFDAIWAIKAALEGDDTPINDNNEGNELKLNTDEIPKWAHATVVTTVAPASFKKHPESSGIVSGAQHHCNINLSSDINYLAIQMESPIGDDSGTGCKIVNKRIIESSQEHEIEGETFTHQVFSRFFEPLHRSILIFLPLTLVTSEDKKLQLDTTKLPEIFIINTCAVNCWARDNSFNYSELTAHFEALDDFFKQKSSAMEKTIETWQSGLTEHDEKIAGSFNKLNAAFQEALHQPVLKLGDRLLKIISEPEFSDEVIYLYRCQYEQVNLIQCAINHDHMRLLSELLEKLENVAKQGDDKTQKVREILGSAYSGKMQLKKGGDSACEIKSYANLAKLLWAKEKTNLAEKVDKMCPWKLSNELKSLSTSLSGKLKKLKFV